MRLTLNKVNTELAKHGPERLRRGKGYFYFVDGDAYSWTSPGVYVNRLSECTLEQWVKERNERAKENE